MAMTTHWQDWHRGYDDPDSSLSRRLVAVQAALREALDVAAAGPVALLSLCAGDGRDVLGVLATHPRGGDVRALLVDSDPALAGAGARAAGDMGLHGVEFLVGDAGSTSTFAHAAPFDVVLLCGIFGNISEDDIAATVAAAPSLLDHDGTVIWTRHRRAPDLTGAIRTWFTQAGFAEDRFVEVADSLASVGRATFARPRGRSVPSRLFTFEGDGADARR
jgi:hypothetical protein